MLISNVKRASVSSVVIVLVMMGMLMLFCSFSPAASSEAVDVVAEASLTRNSDSDIRVIVPIYNNRGIEAVRNVLHPYIRGTDMFLLVSGNFNTLNTSWLNESIAFLKNEYPENPVFVGTGGIEHIALIVNNVTQPFDGMVYIYEPNLPNGQEFTWDFERTLENLNASRALAHSRGLPLVAKPTGRPILQRNLLEYEWDYSKVAQHTDLMFLQTQTYLKRGPDVFDQALKKVGAQFEANGTSSTLWFPQITVDPDAPNGVPVSEALRGLQIIRSNNLTGVLMWWSPRYVQQALEFLRQCR